MVVEFPCSVFTCDPRFNEIEHQIDDMRVGDLNSHTLIDVWYDGPDDFVEWIKEDMYDGKYDCITTILSVIRQYLDSRSSDDYEFEQADIDKLFEYAENTQIKAIFLES